MAIFLGIVLYLLASPFIVSISAEEDKAKPEEGTSYTSLPTLPPPEPGTLPEGSQCIVDSQCESVFCRHGYCYGGIYRGRPCRDSKDCPNLRRCLNQGMCDEEVGVGRKCDSNEYGYCSSQWCRLGICWPSGYNMTRPQTRPVFRYPCNQDDECYSGYCRLNVDEPKEIKYVCEVASKSRKVYHLGWCRNNDECYSQNCALQAIHDKRRTCSKLPGDNGEHLMGKYFDGNNYYSW